MRYRAFFLLPAVLSGGLACGGNGTATGGTGGGSTTSGTTMMTTSGTTMSSGTTTSSMMAGGIPDPGTSDDVDNNFGDVEPNDTPQEATPLGVAMSGDIGVWVNGNAIGGTDTSDYFVFKSGPATGAFSFDICFNAPVTAMTASLWKVVGGTQQMPAVGTWTSSGTCVTDMTSPAMMEASTDYLFGLTATGGSGMYSA